MSGARLDQPAIAVTRNRAPAVSGGEKSCCSLGIERPREQEPLSAFAEFEPEFLELAVGLDSARRLGRKLEPTDLGQRPAAGPR